MTGPLRIERRLDAPGWLKVAVPLASLVLAAVIVGILLLATGHNPLSTYHQMYSAAITADGALTATFSLRDATSFHRAVRRLCLPHEDLEHRR